MFLVHRSGGSVKRSLAMVIRVPSRTIAKACGLDDATQRPDMLNEMGIRH